MQAVVEQWIEFCTLELDAPLASWIYPIMGYMEYNKKVRSCMVLAKFSFHVP